MALRGCVLVIARDMDSYACMWGIGPPLYLALVWSIHEAADNPGMLPLGVFCGSVFLVLASFGGAAATRPALTGDLFGTKNVGVLTARQLSVVMPAAYVGFALALPRVCVFVLVASDAATHTMPRYVQLHWAPHCFLAARTVHG